MFNDVFGEAEQLADCCCRRSVTKFGFKRATLLSKNVHQKDRV
jgi:hypothetical protein